MIIPVRCFSCNNVIGSKYKKYLELSRKHSDLNGAKMDILPANPDIDKQMGTSKDELFLQLGIKRYCCRRHLISHVDLINKI